MEPAMVGAKEAFTPLDTTEVSVLEQATILASLWKLVMKNLEEKVMVIRVFEKLHSLDLDMEDWAMVVSAHHCFSFDFKYLFQLRSLLL